MADDLCRTWFQKFFTDYQSLSTDELETKMDELACTYQKRRNSKKGVTRNEAFLELLTVKNLLDKHGVPYTFADGSWFFRLKSRHWANSMVAQFLDPLLNELDAILLPPADAVIPDIDLDVEVEAAGGAAAEPALAEGGAAGLAEGAARPAPAVSVSRGALTAFAAGRPKTRSMAKLQAADPASSDEEISFAMPTRDGVPADDGDGGPAVDADNGDSGPAVDADNGDGGPDDGSADEGSADEGSADDGGDGLTAGQQALFDEAVDLARTAAEPDWLLEFFPARRRT
jgi:hypothetical protein